MVIRPEPDALRESPIPNGFSLPNEFITSHKITTHSFLPAWQAVARRQTLVAPSYCLIRQPDHAALSGELATQFRSGGFPNLTADAIQAIGQHDSGWSAFPFEAALDLDPPVSGAGHPMSFLEFGPEDFLQAWKGSIDNAGRISPLAGRMVSGHFYRLGQGRLAARVDNDPNARCLEEFLDFENSRQRRLERNIPLSAAEIEALVNVLQFCDVLSLYLCCGAEEAVEFPQTLAGCRIQLQFVDGVFRFNPSPFHEVVNPQLVRSSVSATRYPHPSGPEITRLNFSLS
ncbi:MAG TPA: DUF3891 family protein [Terriglobales bacterium]|nr:DUF3891 family protein [Terriglobales bacterium]